MIIFTSMPGMPDRLCWISTPEGLVIEGYYAEDTAIRLTIKVPLLDLLKLAGLCASVFCEPPLTQASGGRVSVPPITPTPGNR